MMKSFFLFSTILMFSLLTACKSDGENQSPEQADTQAEQAAPASSDMQAAESPAPKVSEEEKQKLLVNYQSSWRSLSNDGKEINFMKTDEPNQSFVLMAGDVVTMKAMRCTPPDCPCKANPGDLCYYYNQPEVGRGCCAVLRISKDTLVFYPTGLEGEKLQFLKQK